MGDRMVTREMTIISRQYVQNKKKSSGAFGQGKLFDFGQNASEIILIPFD